MIHSVYTLLSFLILTCIFPETEQFKYFSAEDEAFRYSGRTEEIGSEVALITSGASVNTLVYGDSCILVLASGNQQHQYISLQLNNNYLGRFRVTEDSIKVSLPGTRKGNVLRIFKDTEAANGTVIFKGISAKKISSPLEGKQYEIEFIGNSITCGMGADTSQIQCGEGEWYDQHNVFKSYGPRVARALDVNFRLNCVSGMGIYRNWNDEDQPVMPEVYPNLYLNSDASRKADLKAESPDIVSIALGTNDLSLGDGEKERNGFDADTFTAAYIAFVENIFSYYPDTKIALLSSPMIGEKEDRVLVSCLQQVKAHFQDKPVAIFDFDKMQPKGCTSHPAVDDHEEMAKALIPFFEEILRH